MDVTHWRTVLFWQDSPFKDIVELWIFRLRTIYNFFQVCKGSPNEKSIYYSTVIVKLITVSWLEDQLYEDYFECLFLSQSQFVHWIRSGICQKCVISSFFHCVDKTISHKCVKCPPRITCNMSTIHGTKFVLLPSSAQSQAQAGLSIALISSNTLTHHPHGQVVNSRNTSQAAPGALAHCLIKLVEHSWQPKLS